jgi:hypothetical protein
MADEGLTAAINVRADWKIGLSIAELAYRLNVYFDHLVCLLRAKKTRLNRDGLTMIVLLLARYRCTTSTPCFLMPERKLYATGIKVQLQKKISLPMRPVDGGLDTLVRFQMSPYVLGNYVLVPLCSLCCMPVSIITKSIPNESNIK